MVQWIEPMSYESAPRGADQLKLDLVPTYVSEIWVEFADGSRKEWPVDVAAGGVAVVTLDG
jgi:hypothetical protein